MSTDINQWAIATNYASETRRLIDGLSRVIVLYKTAEIDFTEAKSKWNTITEILEDYEIFLSNEKLISRIIFD